MLRTVVSTIFAASAVAATATFASNASADAVNDWRGMQHLSYLTTYQCAAQGVEQVLQRDRDLGEGCWEWIHSSKTNNDSSHILDEILGALPGMLTGPIVTATGVPPYCGKACQLARLADDCSKAGAEAMAWTFFTCKHRNEHMVINGRNYDVFDVNDYDKAVAKDIGQLQHHSTTKVDIAVMDRAYNALLNTNPNLITTSEQATTIEALSMNERCVKDNYLGMLCRAQPTAWKHMATILKLATQNNILPRYKWLHHVLLLAWKRANNERDQEQIDYSSFHDFSLPNAYAVELGQNVINDLRTRLLREQTTLGKELSLDLYASEYFHEGDERLMQLTLVPEAEALIHVQPIVKSLGFHRFVVVDHMGYPFPGATVMRRKQQFHRLRNAGDSRPVGQVQHTTRDTMQALGATDRLGNREPSKVMDEEPLPAGAAQQQTWLYEAWRLAELQQANTRSHRPNYELSGNGRLLKKAAEREPAQLGFNSVQYDLRLGKDVSSVLDEESMPPEDRKLRPSVVGLGSQSDFLSAMKELHEAKDPFVPKYDSIANPLVGVGGFDFEPQDVEDRSGFHPGKPDTDNWKPDPPLSKRTEVARPHGLRSLLLTSEIVPSQGRKMDTVRLYDAAGNTLMFSPNGRQPYEAGGLRYLVDDYSLPIPINAKQPKLSSIPGKSFPFPKPGEPLPPPSATSSSPRFANSSISSMPSSTPGPKRCTDLNAQYLGLLQGVARGQLSPSNLQEMFIMGTIHGPGSNGSGSLPQNSNSTLHSNSTSGADAAAESCDKLTEHYVRLLRAVARNQMRAQAVADMFVSGTIESTSGSANLTSAQWRLLR